MADKKSYIVIDNWAGGWSTGSRRGQTGSFRYGKGLNFRDDPDVITANKASVKDSGTTVVDLPKWITSHGTDVYAYGDTGKLYKKTGGSWTVGKSVSNSKGQGLEVYGDYLYYRQNSQIGRLDLVGAGGYTDNWQTSNVQTVTDWGAIKTFLDFVAFANSRYLATWNDSTFTYNKLSFPKNYFVRDLGAMSEYLVMAVNDNETITSVKRGFIFLWDGTSSTYNFQAEVPEAVSSIQAFMDTVYIFGASGTIYEYNGKANKVKKIPYFGIAKTTYVYPGGDTNFNGICHFGLAGGTSTTAYRGVYSWGASELSLSSSLNFEYPISTGTIQGTGMDIGAVSAIGPELYIGWKDGTSYGIDLISSITNQLSATYESLIITTNKPSDYTREKLFFKTLATGESITLEIKKDQGTWETAGTASYATDGAVTTKLLNYAFSCDDVEFRITLTGTYTMPSLSKLIVEGEEDNTL